MLGTVRQQLADADSTPAREKGYFAGARLDADDLRDAAEGDRGEKARAVKARYQGACRQCGAPTQARGGKGDAYAFCKRCRPGAIQPRWTRELVLEAMHAWQDQYGRPPSSYDWSRTHARRRGPEAVARLQTAEWPTSTTVGELFGTWSNARAQPTR